MESEFVSRSRAVNKARIAYLRWNKSTYAELLERQLNKGFFTGDKYLTQRLGDRWEFRMNKKCDRMIAKDRWAHGVEHSVDIKRLLDGEDILKTIEAKRVRLFIRGQLSDESVSHNIIRMAQANINDELWTPGANDIRGKQFFVDQGMTSFTFVVTDVRDLERHAGEHPTYHFDRWHLLESEFSVADLVLNEIQLRDAVLEQFLAHTPYPDDDTRGMTDVIHPMSTVRFAVKESTRLHWRIEDRYRRTWFYYRKDAALDMGKSAGLWLRREYLNCSDCTHINVPSGDEISSDVNESDDVQPDDNKFPDGQSPELIPEDDWHEILTGLKRFAVTNTAQEKSHWSEDSDDNPENPTSSHFNQNVIVSGLTDEETVYKTASDGEQVPSECKVESSGGQALTAPADAGPSPILAGNHADELMIAWQEIDGGYEADEDVDDWIMLAAGVTRMVSTE